MGNATPEDRKMRKFLHTFWPLLFIFFVWGIFSSPFLLSGKIPFTGDYQASYFAPWSQYSQFTQPVKNSAMPDVVDQLYPWKSLVIDSWKHMQIPLWNPYSFGGTPLMANYQSAVFSPMNLLFFIFPFKISWGLLILLQPLLAGIATFFFLRKLLATRIASLLSSISFMFCGFIVCWMGYGTLAYAIGILPLILLGQEGYVQSKKFPYILLISLGLVFSFFSGHFQISIYTLLVAFAYFIFRYTLTNPTNRSGQKKKFVFGFMAIFSGVMLALPQIIPSIEFYNQSLRSVLYSRPEVIPWQYLLTLVAPDFFGNPVTGNDWFGHYAEWNGYIGLIPLLFAGFSLLDWKKNKFVRFFFVAAAVALLLATPTIFGDLILAARIPVLATSAAGRIIVVMSFSLSVLAGFGLDVWVRSRRRKKVLLGCISFVFFLLGWGIILTKLGVPIEKIAIAKQNFILPSFFLVSAILLTTAALFTRSKKVLFVVCFIFLVLSSFDVLRFASKWQTFSPTNSIFPDISLTQFFQKIHNQRSLGNYGGQVAIYYQLPSLEGYDALYPERFGEFVTYVANGSFGSAGRSGVDFPKSAQYTGETVDWLGVHYIIHKTSDDGKIWTFPFWLHRSDFKEVYRDSSYLVLENLNAMPRAYIVGNYEVITNKEKILTALFAKDMDKAKTLILEENPGVVKTSGLVAHASIRSYTPNKVTLTTKSNKNALLFLSDTYFPGWKATIDGKETKIYRADYTFRAIAIPAGQHIVVFSYWPDSFTYGLIGFVFGVSLLTGLYFFQKRRV